ncbi:MAG TPA: stage II sporulation protein M [Vicinamibacterales bacterium]|nr:stage II sporulation protein M [Vicinamibacterales bacterium]
MTPLQFEALYEAEWTELEALLDRVLGRTGRRSGAREEVPGDRVAALYRRACEQLALARARSYPAYLVDRLERLTADGHQVIYRQHEFGAARVKAMLLADFPRAVRAQARYVAAAAALFLLPTIAVGLVVYRQPELILSVVSADTASSFDRMYSPSAEAIGRVREATTDWVMFAFYVRNNIGVAFQCFAGGLFAGLGSVFFLVYNGAFGGAIAGYLTERGMAPTFYSFVATHSAFELTAIVLSGAAGLRIGHALLAPGRLTRGQALVGATRDSAVVLYGVAMMLLIAAAIEAFWSSAQWLAPSLKYSVAAVCWIAVFTYFIRQGRRAA